ncbi:hypothetical protein OPT61_g1086 [Boeremia exigua]|uniref:Uncharacterized protein n=1 Tax=Boeremia exigua TaxID=749465 RepID=A0ACC2IRI7_9PLEO|nr:hypothetical protein OPT61_g1086 [Boeremia exigua]
MCQEAFFLKLINKFHATSCQWAASDEDDKAAALIDLISALRGLFCELQSYMSQGAKALQEQHGGVQHGK